MQNHVIYRMYIEFAKIFFANVFQNQVLGKLVIAKVFLSSYACSYLI